MTATEIAAAIRAAIDRTGRFGAMDLIFATMPDDLRVLLDELDRLQHDHHQVRADAQARVDAAVVRALAAERERDTLRTRLAELEKQEPVAWKRADWSGSESPTLQFDPPPDRPTVRDELTAPVWTPLYARPGSTIPSGWQPIETAPKGAAKVLLMWPGYRPPCAGSWRLDNGAMKPAPYWSGDTDRIYGLRETRKLQPTHWMPIPAAPEAAR